MSPEQRRWHKVVEVLEEPIAENARLRPSPYLEVRLGARKTSFRVNFRQGDINLREVLEGDFSSVADWREAQRMAELLIARAKSAGKPKEKSFVRSEELCREIVALKNAPTFSEATYEQAEIFYRKHIIPFLNGECAYADEEKVACRFAEYLERGRCELAANLNPTIWLTYKAHFRLHRPDGSLFNHWKFFTSLYKYAFEKGLLERPVKLPFDEEREDSRERGLVIPDGDFQKLAAAANQTWRDRMIVQRLTGQRPGLIRKLRKDQVDLDSCVIHVLPADSKNRREYRFKIPPAARGILRARLERKYVKDSPFFFPMETDHSRPMDKHLGGWRSALKRAAVNPKYTPHDLRHTYLTERFKTSKNPALVCYACDLSLEEAMGTYVHFSAEDTAPVADEAELRAHDLLSTIGEVVASPEKGAGTVSNFDTNLAKNSKSEDL